MHCNHELLELFSSCFDISIKVNNKSHIVYISVVNLLNLEKRFCVVVFKYNMYLNAKTKVLLAILIYENNVTFQYLLKHGNSCSTYSRNPEWK